MPWICRVCTLEDFLQEEVSVEGDACASPWVQGAGRVGDVAGRVCLGTRGSCPNAGMKPVFKRQSCIIRMVFHKKCCSRTLVERKEELAV